MASPPSSPRPHRSATRLLVAVSATLALLIGAGSAYGFATYQSARDEGTRAWSPPTTGPSSAGSQPADVGGPCVRNVCNYLLLGSDSRSNLSPEQQEQFGSDEVIGGENRSDTIMLVHSDPAREKVVILSFPRDLWVEIPGHGFGKINSAFEGGIDGGGPLLVAKTLHKLTGLRINHFLYVDLGGFQGVVDTLGGVQMCIPTDLYDINAGLDLKAGCQTLDGYQALAYVRTRHLPCDTVPDFARISRQQQFLRALINRLLQPAELLRVPTLIHPILGNMTRDKGLSPADLVYLVGQLRGITTGAADFRAVSGSGDTIDGLSVVRMDPSAEALFAALRDGTRLPPATGTELAGTPPSEANIRVPVVEHGRDTAAADVEQVLSEGGFDISPGIVPYAALGTDVTGSAIAYTPGGEVQAQVVARYFPDLRLVPVDDLGEASVAIVVTPTYRPRPVGAEPPAPTDCIDPNG
jgi:LCP family protein required for cell wall assembly